MIYDVNTKTAAIAAARAVIAGDVQRARELLIGWRSFAGGRDRRPTDLRWVDAHAGLRGFHERPQGHDAPPERRVCGARLAEPDARAWMAGELSSTGGMMLSKTVTAHCDTDRHADDYAGGCDVDGGDGFRGAARVQRSAQEA